MNELPMYATSLRNVEIRKLQDRIAELEAQLAALADVDPNAEWLSLAHIICADAGIPPGHIVTRLTVLRDQLAAPVAPDLAGDLIAAAQGGERQSVDVARLDWLTTHTHLVNRD